MRVHDDPGVIRSRLAHANEAKKLSVDVNQCAVHQRVAPTQPMRDCSFWLFQPHHVIRSSSRHSRIHQQGPEFVCLISRQGENIPFVQKQEHEEFIIHCPSDLCVEPECPTIDWHKPSNSDLSFETAGKRPTSLSLPRTPV